MRDGKPSQVRILSYPHTWPELGWYEHRSDKAEVGGSTPPGRTAGCRPNPYRAGERGQRTVTRERVANPAEPQDLSRRSRRTRRFTSMVQRTRRLPTEQEIRVQLLVGVRTKIGTGRGWLRAGLGDRRTRVRTPPSRHSWP